MKQTFWAITLLFLVACGNKKPRAVIEYNGYAQGTTFHIIYDQASGNLNSTIDALFKAIDQSMSLYDSSSIICKVNRVTDSTEVDEHFKKVFEKSQLIYKETEGAFNPAIYPLVKFWGFGAEKFQQTSFSDSIIIDCLLKHIDFSSVSIKSNQGKNILIKKDPKVQLDFNAIAQGYTVDCISELLDKNGIMNYMIEVGGETRCKGVNKTNEPWRVGIDKPIEDPTTRELMAIANISDLSLATSGSYRKFYEKNGMKYSHTIDPKTGYPVSHHLISASVFTKNCAEADAYATAFMVMGTDKTKKFIDSRNDLGVYLIYSDYKGEWETFLSESLKPMMEILKAK